MSGIVLRVRCSQLPIGINIHTAHIIVLNTSAQALSCEYYAI